MKRFISRFVSMFLAFSWAIGHAYAQPSIEQFKQVFVKTMEQLKSEGYSRRNIVFVDVVKGTPSGGYYPFKVTAYVHDYAPGYPSNQYYGQTCLGKIEGYKYDMVKDDFGSWIVQGAFTARDNNCKNNASEGDESIPLASVPGKLYMPGKEDVKENKMPVATSNLYIGEYACYGTGNRLMAGMGFTLKSNKTYVDLDNRRGGTYTYNAKNATIAFTGGFLSGQVGKNVKPTGFQISNTVTAAPWR